MNLKMKGVKEENHKITFHLIFDVLPEEYR